MVSGLHDHRVVQIQQIRHARQNGIFVFNTGRLTGHGICTQAHRGNLTLRHGMQTAVHRCIRVNLIAVDMDGMHTVPTERTLVVIADKIIKHTHIAYTRISIIGSQIEEIDASCAFEPDELLGIYPGTVTLVANRTNIDIVISLLADIRHRHRAGRQTGIGGKCPGMEIIEHHVVRRCIAGPGDGLVIAMITHIGRRRTGSTRINTDIIYLSCRLRCGRHRIKP